MESTPQPAPNQNFLYPIFLKLSNLELLIVGGGNVALEKLTSILSNSPNANITLIAPLIKSEVSKISHLFPNVKLLKRKFETEDLMGKSMIICTTDDPALHQEIRKKAIKMNQWVNVADTPDLCDFYLSSIVQKGNLKIAISTNGLSPTGAKRIKESLDDALPGSLDQVLKDLNLIRNNLKGDFAFKIKKMKEVTIILGMSHQQIRKKRISQVLISTLAIIVSVLIGYFVGKF